MRWRFLGKRSGNSLADRYIREHERWLNGRALDTPPPPRIPTRRVDQGGFSGLRARPHGRDRADLWWELAFTRLDADP